MKNTNKWHLTDGEECVGTLSSDATRGLSSRDAAGRLKRNGKNDIWKIKRASVKGYALEVLSDLATVLLIVTAALAAVFDYRAEAVAICVILLVGGVLRVVTYIRAQRIFETMSRAVIPKTGVVRDGRVHMISSEDVVTGDILLLFAGDTVPADARIIQADNLAVSEDRITENKGAVPKSAATLDEGISVSVERRSNMLFAATTVVSGNARAVVTSTGRRTYVAARHGGLVIPAGEEIALISRLEVWCRYASLIMLGAVVVITFAALLRSSGAGNAASVFLSAISLAVASMSEYFCAIGRIIIANSVWAIKDSAAVKDAAAVEKIAETDCIIVASADMLKSGEITVDGGFSAEGAFSGALESKIFDRLLWMIHATTGALPAGVSFGGRGGDAYYDTVRRVCAENASSPLKPDGYSVRAYRRAGDDRSGGVDTVLISANAEITAVCGGSYARILALCSDYEADGEVRPLSDSVKRRIAEMCAEYEGEMATVIAVAKSETPFNNLTKIHAIQEKMTFVGFVALAEPLADNAAENIAVMRDAGYSFVLLSKGTDTEKAIAEKSGILRNTDRILAERECADLYSFSLDKGECALVNIPSGQAGAHAAEQLVAALKRGGRHTAYIGSRPADIRAMTGADVSFASVTDAPAVRTPLVLSSRADVPVSAESGGFVGAVSAVGASRSALLKIRQAISYMLSSQIARLAIMIGGAFFGSPLMNSVQLLILGLIVDFIAVLCISHGRPKKGSAAISLGETGLYKFDKSVMLPVLMGLIWGVTAIAAPYIAGVIAGGYSHGGAVTAMFAASLACSLICAAENGALPERGGVSGAHAAVLICFGVLAVALGVMAFAFPPFTALIGGSLDIASAVSAAAAPVFVLITYEICKKIG